MKPNSLIILGVSLATAVSTFAASNDSSGFYKGKLKQTVGGSDILDMTAVVGGGRISAGASVPSTFTPVMDPDRSRVKKNGKFRGRIVSGGDIVNSVGGIRKGRRMVGTLKVGGGSFTYRINLRKR